MAKITGDYSFHIEQVQGGFVATGKLPRGMGRIVTQSNDENGIFEMIADAFLTGLDIPARETKTVKEPVVPTDEGEVFLVAIGTASKEELGHVNLEALKTFLKSQGTPPSNSEKEECKFCKEGSSTNHVHVREEPVKKPSVLGLRVVEDPDMEPGTWELRKPV